MQKYYDTPIYYGKTLVNWFVPTTMRCKYLVPTCNRTPLEDLKKELYNALEKPIERTSLRKMISQHYTRGQRITIIVDDVTRPNVHTRQLLPLLWEYLREQGVQKDDVLIFVASGTHRATTREELETRVLGPEGYAIFKNNVFVHRCDENVEYLGESRRGTPIFISSEVIDSSLVIGLSDSEYHYFAGVAGTLKQFVPGCAGCKTISVNHSRIFDVTTGFKKECGMGSTANNPCIQDIKDIVEVISERVPIFGIDALLKEGKICHIHAGNIFDLHERAKKKLGPLREVNVEERADVVLCAKDAINLYQAGKAIDTAKYAVKEGGIIIVLAPCTNGHGSEEYLKAMQSVKNKPIALAMKEIIETRCTEDTFQAGIQNAVDVLSVLNRVGEGNIKIITEMTEEELKIFRMSHVPIMGGNIQETLENLIEDVYNERNDPLIYVLPSADTLVNVKGESDIS